ncbi:MAG: DUF4446 family protein [Actinobacteria bacterium]|nr:DUF4446 family protein [Actinomycetota bacterium]
MELFGILAIVAIVVAVAAGAGLVLVYRRLQHYQRNQRMIIGSRGTVDIVEHVSGLDEKLTNVRLALEDLTLATRDHDVRIDNTLSRMGIVRFDAYYDLGGRQSTAVAFLNSLGDGVVITTVVSRDFARMYVKLIKDGQPDIPLAPEEKEAVEQAHGTGPFTIRPRVEGGISEETVATEGAEALAASGAMADGLPGLRNDESRELARENRRRKRHGLPYVEGEVVPSARGWDEPETPSANSLAEKFVREHKQNLGKNADGTDPDDLPDTEEAKSREL